MVMEAEKTFQKLSELMRGLTVTKTRIFLFTLQIYVGTDEQDTRPFELWCEPSWQLCNAAGIVTGSGAIETPSTYSEDDEVERASATIEIVSAATKVLVGQTLERITLDSVTHALRAEFSDSIWVATFLDDPNADPLWVLRDPNSHMAVRATSRGLAKGSRGRVV